MVDDEFLFSNASSSSSDQRPLVSQRASSKNSRLINNRIQSPRQREGIRAEPALGNLLRNNKDDDSSVSNFELGEASTDGYSQTGTVESADLKVADD